MESFSKMNYFYFLSTTGLLFGIFLIEDNATFQFIQENILKKKDQYFFVYNSLSSLSYAFRECWL